MEKIIIVLVIFILIFGGIYYYFKNQSAHTAPPTKNNPFNYPTNSIHIYSDNSKTTGLGWIKIENRTIVYEITDPEIKTYLDQNATKIASLKLYYPTGGMTKNGTLWDGRAETTIDKNDFILGLRMYLEPIFRNELKKNYYLSLN